jgi:hypothetical protein
MKYDAHKFLFVYTQTSAKKVCLIKSNNNRRTRGISENNNGPIILSKKKYGKIFSLEKGRIEVGPKIQFPEDEICVSCFYGRCPHCSGNKLSHSLLYMLRNITFLITISVNICRMPGPTRGIRMTSKRANEESWKYSTAGRRWADEP